MTKLNLIKLKECIKILVMSFYINWISLQSHIFYFIHLKMVLEVVSRLHHTAKKFPEHIGKAKNPYPVLVI